MTTDSPTRLCGGLNVRPMPVALRDMFKAACAKRGKTMQQVLTKFMREYVAEADTVNPKRRRK